jgi:hypothetical protein
MTLLTNSGESDSNWGLLPNLGENGSLAVLGDVMGYLKITKGT